MVVRIRQIIDVSPENPGRATVVADKDRAKDVRTITRIFEWMPYTEMDYLLEHGAGRIKKHLIDSAKQFESFTDCLAFHVTDKPLRQRIIRLGNIWADLLEKLPKSYTLEKDAYLNNSILKGSRKTNSLTQYLIEDIDKAYVSMLKYVGENYSEL